MIELRGVLSSWATEEKNIERCLLELDWSSLILVKLFKKPMISDPSLIS